MVLRHSGERFASTGYGCEAGKNVLRFVYSAEVQKALYKLHPPSARNTTLVSLPIRASATTMRFTLPPVVDPVIAKRRGGNGPNVHIAHLPEIYTDVVARKRKRASRRGASNDVLRSSAALTSARSRMGSGVSVGLLQKQAHGNRGPSAKTLQERRKLERLNRRLQPDVKLPIIFEMTSNRVMYDDVGHAGR